MREYILVSTSRASLLRRDKMKRTTCTSHLLVIKAIHFHSTLFSQRTILVFTFNFERQMQHYVFSLPENNGHSIIAWNVDSKCFHREPSEGFLELAGENYATADRKFPGFRLTC